MEYLTEKRLIDFIRIVFKDKELRCNKALGRFRPDIYIPEYKLLFEFDGPRHFISAKTCLRDIRLKKYTDENDLILVNIPYFIQIDISIYNQIFDKYKNINDEIINVLKDYKYPHGFIDKRAILPSDFCTLGIKRFKEMLEIYPTTKKAIIKSLDIHIENSKDILEVYPISLYEELH